MWFERAPKRGESCGCRAESALVMVFSIVNPRFKLPPHKRTSQLWSACGIRKFTGSTFNVHLPNSHTSSFFSPSYAFRCPHSAPTKPSPPLITAIPERAPAAAVSPRFIGQVHRVNTLRLSLVVLIFNILVPVEPEITVSPDPDQYLQVLLLPCES